MCFIDKYYEKFNNSVGEHNITISRLEFAKLLGVFSKHEQQLHRYKQVVKEIKEVTKQNMDDKQIIAVQTMLNDSPNPKNRVLEQIIQKCEEVNKCAKTENT